MIFFFFFFSSEGAKNMKHPTVADASFTTSVAVELFAVRDYNTADVVPTAAPPPPNTLPRYFQESRGFNLTLSGVISARQTHQRLRERICVLLGAHYSNGQTRLSWFGFYISLASAADMSL